MRNTRDCKRKILEFTEKYPVIETFMETNQSISLTEEEHKAVHRYFQLESEKEMIEEEYHFYMGQAQMISYGAMLGKIKKAILGKDDGDTQKLLELLLDTWIDEIEETAERKYSVTRECWKNNQNMK